MCKFTFPVEARQFAEATDPGIDLRGQQGNSVHRFTNALTYQKLGVKKRDADGRGQTRREGAGVGGPKGRRCARLTPGSGMNNTEAGTLLARWHADLIPCADGVRRFIRVRKIHHRI